MLSKLNVYYMSMYILATWADIVASYQPEWLARTSRTNEGPWNPGLDLCRPGIYAEFGRVATVCWLHKCDSTSFMQSEVKP